MACALSTILSELGFRFDPNNLYQQTATQVLGAAELLELPNFLQLILAQPKNELMVHFPRPDGQRQLPAVQGLPRAAQQPARAIQGRHPFPPVGIAGRCKVAFAPRGQ